MPVFRPSHALAIALAGLAITPVAWAQSAPPDASGPQTAIPAPVPNGKADVPGGSAQNGVIKPPPTGGTMPIVTPPAPGRTPVIKPPGSTPSTRRVQPK